MSGVDVRDLAGENLPDGEFPASSESKFRLFLSPNVHRGIQQHAKADTSIEICGVLVGLWKQDEQGPYADAQDYIRCDNASSKFAEVTFTHESWSQINQEMDSKYDDARILGWYHSHPDFGIFLSDRDCFIQENFFSGAGQVAYVVDPVRELEGVFAWSSGKPELLPHYWIGEKICTSHSSVRSSKTEQAAFQSGNGLSGDNMVEGGSSFQMAPRAEISQLSLATQLLAWTAVFLLGYLLAGWRTSWERQRVVEGVVAHYGVDKVIKLGLQENLTEVQARLQTISAEFQKLPSSTKDLTEEELKALAEQRILITKNLDFLVSALDSISKEFSFSDEERAAIYRLVAKKHAALRQLQQQQTEAKEKKSIEKDEMEKASKVEASKPQAAQEGGSSPQAPAPVESKTDNEAPVSKDNQDPVER